MASVAGASRPLGCLGTEFEHAEGDQLMKAMRWVFAAAIAALLPTVQAKAEPCGSAPLVPGDPGVVAPNCIDCSVAGGCTIYKYGLTNPDNYDFRRSNDPFARSHEDFPTGSYAFNRQVLTTGTGCGPERDFAPIQGQVTLREQTSCVPTSEGPTGAGGCPVEIPRAVSGVTPRADKTAWSNGARVITSVRSLLASSSATLGGTSDPYSTNPVCLASNIRLINAQGTRYLLPASRGGDGVKTYIKWRDVPGQGLYRHDDDSEFCCTSPTGLACASGAGTTPFQEYPINTVRTCASPSRIYELLQTNDWIFQGDKNTRFETDPNHIVPGEFHGVCLNNRFQPCTLATALSSCTGPGTPHLCCTGAGQGTCGTECNALGDTCDVRERGIRQTIPTNQATGFPDPTRCNTFQAVLRGTPGQYCVINEKYENPGDPGAGCLIWNFGFRTRPDLDCNGVPDAIPNGGPSNDLCPFFNEYDYFKDTDGDCALGRCRGDECECTDQNEDGRNTVADLVAINVAIFNPDQKLEICDGNNDLSCNVSDIVSSNIELFAPDTSACRHITSARCGNSILDAGEACDDGARCQGGPTPGALCDAAGVNTCGTGGSCARQGGDGCNTVCRVEAGWTCSGSPSVCTHL
jgi:hypothetical protein